MKFLGIKLRKKPFETVPSYNSHVLIHQLFHTTIRSILMIIRPEKC